MSEIMQYWIIATILFSFFLAWYREREKNKKNLFYYKEYQDQAEQVIADLKDQLSQAQCRVVVDEFYDTKHVSLEELTN